jgi:hypothetical protein
MAIVIVATQCIQVRVTTQSLSGAEIAIIHLKLGGDGTMANSMG